MIEALLFVLTAFAFGFGVSLTLFGILLLHQIFIQGKAFNSWMMMVQVGLLSTSVGLTLLWMVLS